MSEAFCILYQDRPGAPASRKLSRSYETLELALRAAFEILRRDAEPLQIRGSEGTVVEKIELQEALALAGAE
jgi:hypothetical protein